MTVNLSQLERTWFAKKVNTGTANTPLGDLKRAYFISQIGGPSASVHYLEDLEKQWLRGVITAAGQTPVTTRYVSQLWKQAVAALGFRVSNFENDNKITFYINQP